jgi:hypothetical protein
MKQSFKKAAIAVGIFMIWIFFLASVLGSCASNNYSGSVAFLTKNTYNLEERTFLDDETQILITESLINITTDGSTWAVSATEPLIVSNAGRMSGYLIDYKTSKRYHVYLDMRKRSMKLNKVEVGKDSLPVIHRYLWFDNLKEIPTKIII